MSGKDSFVIAKTANKPRADFPVGQAVRFGDLQNGDEFMIQNIAYRKRTDWYELRPFVDERGIPQSHLIKSSANTINEAVM
ncbi:MAG TPA: hypothetical protein PLD47_12280 [Aggregatilineales bacterium]|nr:hypothetical protein [Anaerolineales bacterium]HRE48493.1 hypothetical protein [Aggregatilineales bacterium]